MRPLVTEILADRAARAPDAPFVKCGGDWLSNAELDSISDRVAAGLASIGATSGDRVAYIAPNRQEILEFFFAGAKLGVIHVMLNYWLKGEFLRYQLADSGARILVVDELGYQAAAGVLEGTPVEQIVLLDEATDVAPETRSVPYADLRTSPGPRPDVAIGLGDPLAIMYTSGTTGVSKGCVLPHGYYTAAGRELGGAGLVVPGDRVLTAFPLFHAGGQSIALMAALANDAAICFEPQFSASQFMPRARAERATMLWGVGPMGMAILAQPPTPTDRDHQLRLAAWVPMSPQAQLEFEERFGVPVTAEMYGQTECQPITLSAVTGVRNRLSAGSPAPHLEVRVVDDNDQDVAVGEPGEIVVRAREPYAMFSGYWGKPEATVEASRNLWHHTGDLGTVDEAGCITFVDRKKDAMRRRGENVSSFELEAAISRHPAVVRAAVIPVPSPLGEDDIKACLVVDEGHAPTPEELFAFFKEHLPYFAIPRYVQIRDSLPTTAATDRVQKHVLREEGIGHDAWDFEELGLVVSQAERRG